MEVYIKDLYGKVVRGVKINDMYCLNWGEQKEGEVLGVIVDVDNIDVSVKFEETIWHYSTFEVAKHLVKKNIFKKIGRKITRFSRVETLIKALLLSLLIMGLPIFIGCVTFFKLEYYKVLLWSGVFMVMFCVYAVMVYFFYKRL